MANQKDSNTNSILEKCKKDLDEFLKKGRNPVSDLSKSAYQLRMTIMVQAGKDLIVPTSGSLNGIIIEAPDSKKNEKKDKSDRTQE